MKIKEYTLDDSIATLGAIEYWLLIFATALVGLLGMGFMDYVMRW